MFGDSKLSLGVSECVYVSVCSAINMFIVYC